MKTNPQLASRFDALKASGMLPSPKGVALALIELTRQDNASSQQIVRTVETDPALVARLIKLANSCLTAGSRPILAIRDAISMLGLNAVRGLALGMSLLSQSRSGQCAGFDYAAYWSRNLACAVAMRSFNARTRLMQTDESFTLGLLARVGDLGLASLFAIDYARLLKGGPYSPAQLRVLELAAFDFDHTDLAAALLQDWGFPPILVEVVQLHETAPVALGPQASRTDRLVRALMLSARTADLCMAAPEQRAALWPGLLALGEALDLSGAELQDLCDETVHNWGDWCALLALSARSLPPFAELARAAEEAPGAPSAQELQHFMAEISRLNQRIEESRQRDQHNEQRMELALSGSDLGLWDWHIPSGKVTFDSRWCNMLGYRVHELEPGVQSWRRLMHPQDAAGVTEALNAHLAGGQAPYQTEHRLRHKSGHWIWVLDRGRVVERDAEGRPLRMVGTHSDISARKAMEAELLRSNRELEQFSYSISHDMRQPLRMISSYLQLLKKSLGESLGAEQRQYLHFAVDGAQRMDGMMLGLLEYSRVGRRGEPMAWVDARTLLDEALHFLKPNLQEARAQVQVQGDWPKIWASPDELLRLMQNLLANALKFRRAQQPLQITVSARSSAGHWRLCVADNGVGLQPDQIGRLFQMFSRLQSRTAFEGHGIGLALCRKIAEHHGGKIWAESAGEGQGSQFCLELPQDATAPEHA